MNISFIISAKINNNNDKKLELINWLLIKVALKSSEKENYKILEKVVVVFI